MALTCSNCGKELPDDAKFCGDCGTSVTSVSVQEKKQDCCANCFAVLPENVKFCMQCGKPAVVAQRTPPPKDIDEALLEKLRVTSPQHGILPFDDDGVADFGEYKAIITLRARKWAEYLTSGWERIHWIWEFFVFGTTILSKIEGDFQTEGFYYFRTNKPNHQKALFCEEVYKYYLYEFRQQGVLTWDDQPQPTPLFFDFLRNVFGWNDEDIREYKVKLPTIEEIRGLAAKDDELFPPPQPLRVEVAGAILNFTTDEGVLVVYADCVHKGKTVEIDKFSERYIWSNCPDKKAEIRERTVENTVLCAAIFNHIPFVTNHHRHDQQVLMQMACTVKATLSASFENRWEETVTVLRGQVTELDWRGRK